MLLRSAVYRQQLGPTSEHPRFYKAIRATNPPGPSIAEARVNQIGYRLLRTDKTDAAIALFALNVEFYPNSSNVYDGLGEAFAKKGDKRSAIENYERALQLNPFAGTAKKALQELRR